MATNIEQYNINLQGQEVFDLYQDPYIIDESFADVVQTMDNVPPNVTKKMQFTAIEDSITRAKDFCEFSPVGGDNITERNLQTYYVGIDKEWCLKDLQNTVWMYQTNTGIRREEVTGTLLGSIMVNNTLKAAKNDRTQLLWWGNRGATDANAAQHNAADGFWGYWIPYFNAQSAITNTTAFANAQLGAGDSIDLLEAVYRQSNQVLKSSNVADLIYYVDQNVWDALWVDFAAKVSGSVIGETRLADGRFIRTYRGIEVRLAPLWASQAVKFYPTAYNSGFANLCILTHKRTLLHDTDTMSEEFVSWYDMSLNVNKFKLRYAMGTNIIYPELISTAFNH